MNIINLNVIGTPQPYSVVSIFYYYLFYLFIYLFVYFLIFFTLITAILLTSRLQKITYNTVTSIATLLTFFVVYKYVRYSAIQYLKQYWLKSD